MRRNRPMFTPPRRRPWAAALGGLGALALTAVAVGAVVVGGSRLFGGETTTTTSTTTTIPAGIAVGSVADRYFAAWQTLDYSAMRSLVTDPPADFEVRHREWEDVLGVEVAEFAVVTVDIAEGTAVAGFDAKLRLSGIGEWPFSGALPLVNVDGTWLVDWKTTVIHPALRSGLRFHRSSSRPDRAPIVDRNGMPINAIRETYTIGVEPRRIVDMDELTTAFQEHLDIAPEIILTLLGQPNIQPDWFVPVAEVSLDVYTEVRPLLYPVGGVIFRSSESRRPPTEEFAAQLVGRVGEVTAELLDELGAPYVPGDVVGRSGLERVFERRLAGSPTTRIEIVDGTGSVVEVLIESPGTDSLPLQLTLDSEVQLAADAAVAGVELPVALVALDVATAEILAVASRPLDQFNRALDGLYPPGSTFKIITAAAALGAGTGPDDRVACPDRILIGGREIHNASGVGSGSGTLTSAFARSCNTTFADLGSQLDATVLERTAALFGFGVIYDLGVPTSGGRFPEPADLADQAVASIGQGRVVASPVHMASVTAAVASGSWRPPSILLGAGAGDEIPLDPAVVDALRSMMRAAVVSGTGRAADVPGEPVHGKTGSAEFGEAVPPPTHAWFVGFRGTVAFAVLVEGGGAGSTVAAPVAAAFLEALDAS